MQPDAVTPVVVATFAELGAAEAEPITRTILLQDRYFVGYQFHCGDMRAVWFADRGVIKFHDAAGKLVRRVESQEQVKKAA